MSIKEDDMFIFQPENFKYVSRATEWCNKNYHIISDMIRRRYLIFRNEKGTGKSLEYLEMVHDILIPKIANSLKRKNIDSVEELGVLVYYMIKNGAKNYIRKKMRHRRKLRTLDEGQQPPLWTVNNVNSEGVEWGVTGAETLAQNIFIFLAKYYDVKYIKLYKLFYCDGLSQCEISNQVGLSQPTVSRAIKEMTEFLIQRKDELRELIDECHTD